MDFKLQDIGLTQEELQDRVVEHIADQMIDQVLINLCEEPVEADSGDEESTKRPKKPAAGVRRRMRTEFVQRVKKRVNERFDAEIDQLVASVTQAEVKTVVDNFMLHPTNAYGETKGSPMTLTEYVVRRVKKILKEPTTKSSTSIRSHKTTGVNIDTAIRDYVTQIMQANVNDVAAELNAHMKESMLEVSRMVADKIKIVASNKR